MKELTNEAKILGTQAWLLDHNISLKDVKTYSDAKKLVKTIMGDKRHVEGGSGSDHSKENFIIRNDMKNYFGYTDEELKAFGKSGSGSWYLRITGEMQSILVNSIIFLTNAKPDPVF